MIPLQLRRNPGDGLLVRHIRGQRIGFVDGRRRRADPDDQHAVADRADDVFRIELVVELRGKIAGDHRKGFEGRRCDAHRVRRSGRGSDGQGPGLVVDRMAVTRLQLHRLLPGSEAGVDESVKAGRAGPYDEKIGAVGADSVFGVTERGAKICRKRRYRAGRGLQRCAGGSGEHADGIAARGGQCAAL